MPFLCQPETPHSVKPQQREFSSRLVFPDSGSRTIWEICYSDPSLTNLRIRHAHEPLVLLDGYLSNRSYLLGQLGDTVNTGTTDAEVIGLYLGNCPNAALENLKGCLFVCALSPANGRMELYRDRLGGRTGYWIQTPSYPAAASHASALARLKGRFVPDTSFIAACFSLSGRPPMGRSSFTDINELMPGETIRQENGHFVRSRASVIQRKDPLPHDLQDQADEFKRLLTLSVENTLCRERGTAAMVSGGLDSGPMAVIADQLLSRSGKSLHAISWHLPNCPPSDERRWVELLQPRLQNPIEFFDGTELSPFQSVSKEQVSPEAPLWNPCRALVEECYSSAAQLGCGVILNGNAGDLLYPERAWLFLETLQREGFQAVLGDIAWIVRHHGWRTVMRDPAFRRLVARKIGVDTVRRLRPSTSKTQRPWLTTYAQKHLLNDACLQQEEGFGYPEHFRNVFGQSMAFGRAHEQPYALKHGIERRDPYQDEDLATFMVSLPFKSSHFKDKSKYVARLAARELLPEALWKKRRTGDLKPLINAGMTKYRQTLSEILERRDAWQEWVRPEAVREALAQPEPSGHQQLLICQCLAYILWLEHHNA